MTRTVSRTMTLALAVAGLTMLALFGLPRESTLVPDVASAAVFKPVSAPPARTLCAREEHVVFSCQVKRSAKIVSICASNDLDKDHGYLQYRFGLPDHVELEFPKSRQGTQQQFQYSHYFRAQVDETEIGFTIGDYQYSVFDTYNGEEKPAISQQGVSVTAPGKPKEVSFVCSAKPKADYSKLADVLPQNSQ